MQVLLLHHLLLHHLLHLHLHRQDDECYEGAVLDVVRAVVRLEGGGIYLHSAWQLTPSANSNAVRRNRSVVYPLESLMPTPSLHLTNAVYQLASCTAGALLKPCSRSMRRNTRISCLSDQWV